MQRDGQLLGAREVGQVAKPEQLEEELALSRQAVPTVLRKGKDAGNLSAKGGYVASGDGKRDVTLIATGSEVGLAAEAAATLAGEGIKAAVVSMPSFELFRAQDAAYREDVLGSAPRIAVEAGVAQGWHEWLRPGDRFIGLSDFGASAPGPKVFEYFGLTPEKIAAAARVAAKKT